MNDMTINPLDRQVGGTHYKGMGIQPLEFAMMNQWDAAAFSVLKYLSRYRTKNGVEDLRKARHFVELRREMIHFRFAPLERVPMSRYCFKNRIIEKDAAVLYELERWVIESDRDDHTTLLNWIDELIVAYETEREPLLPLS